MIDPTLRLLARLPPAVPDPLRAARVRAACGAALRKHARVRQEPPRDVGMSWRPLVAGLGAIYLAATIRLALHLSGLF